MLTGNKKDIYKLLPFVIPRLAQALAYIAYIAEVYPAGPEPMIRHLVCCSIIKIVF